MKRTTISRVVLLSVFVLSSVLWAQAPEKMKANIPFDFNVDGASLSAGNYTLSSPSWATIQLRGVDSHEIATVSTHSAEKLVAGERGKLVFHRYGSVYYLAQVWGPNQTIGRELPRSAAEKETAKSMKEFTIAMVWMQ
jgi:hypothetical protein